MLDVSYGCLLFVFLSAAPRYTIQLWCGCFLSGTCSCVPRALLCSLRSCCSLARLSSGGVCHFKGPVCLCGHGLRGARRMCCGGCLLAHGSSLNYVAPLRWPLSPLSAVVSASFFWQCRLVRGVLLCLFALLLVLPPPSLLLCCWLLAVAAERTAGGSPAMVCTGKLLPLGPPSLVLGRAVSHSLTHSETY